MKQKVLNTIPSLIVAAQKASGGANEYAATLGLVRTTKALIDAEIAALVLARDNHNAAKAELTTRRDVQNVFVDSAIAWLTIGRDVLKITKGPVYSVKWDGTGWRDSLKIPRSPDRILALLLSLKSFFAANAALEIPQLNVTAANAELMAVDLLAHRNAVNAQVTVVKTLLAVRDEKEAALRSRLAGGIKELSMVLTPLDPRWLAFGFNLPGAKEVPPAPENVVAVLIGLTAMSLKWDAAARAEYYRVWKMVEGVDTEFVAVGNPADLDFTLEGLQAGQRVKIAISAVNNGGESVKSTILEVVMR
jgi:hypothetical protein